MFSVHQQTVRLYEKEGLISPKRSEGNTRLFSQEDVDKLEQIIYYTHELGINLAGVEMVLKQQKLIKKLQKEINRAFQATQEHLDKEGEFYKMNAQQSAQKLVSMSRDKKSSKNNHDDSKQKPIDIEQWQIDYEE